MFIRRTKTRTTDSGEQYYSYRLVTTYRVGMAVPDWPTTFDHSMFAYPLEEMLESWSVTLEHSHRMLATVVGALTLATVIAVAFSGGRRALVTACLAARAEVALVGAVVAQTLTRPSISL